MPFSNVVQYSYFNLHVVPWFTEELSIIKLEYYLDIDLIILQYLPQQAKKWTNSWTLICF